MKEKNFNMVTNCGDYARTIYRYKDICYIGCFSGNKYKAVSAIIKKYGIIGSMPYLKKLFKLFTTSLDEDVVYNFNINKDKELVISSLKFMHYEPLSYILINSKNYVVNYDTAMRLAVSYNKLVFIKQHMNDRINIYKLIDIFLYYGFKMFICL